MPTYISILRGINVTGQKLIKMQALKKLYEKLKFENIQTYLQSGNVVFSAKEKEPQKLERQISSQIEKEFGFDVPVIVFSTKAFKTIVDNNPFTKDKTKDPSYLHVTFLAETPAEIDEAFFLEKKLPGEEISFAADAVYLYCPNGYGKTKLHTTFLESKLKVQATTRNWKTTTALLELTAS